MSNNTYLEDPQGEQRRLIAELRRHNTEISLILQRLDQLAEDTEREGGGPSPVGWGADWPREDLSHMSRRKAIVRWLELLPDKRPASPDEIRAGLTAARPSVQEDHGTTQQLIYGLAQEGKIQRVGWGQYAAC